MRIEIRGKDIELDKTMKDYIEHRLQSGLDRFSARIARVTVQILDINGPHGGPDKSCRIEIRLHPRGRIFVKDTDAHFHAAVDRAVDCAACAVGREIERVRMLSRTAHKTRPASRGFDEESTTDTPSSL